VDRFAPRLAFYFVAQADFFEEVAKFRAARRVWAKIMKERFGATDARSMMLRTHTQTGGSTLTAQQPENNIVRAAIQALAAALGGVQSMALSCYDEALAIPTEKAQKIAVRTQQIIAEEIGVTDTIDPMAGSYYIEWLTDELERRAVEEMEKLEEMGGAVEAIESGYYHRAILDEAYKWEQAVNDGERVVVGVNKYRDDDEPEPEYFKVDQTMADLQRAKLERLREERDAGEAEKALTRLRDAAEGDDNLMPAIIEAVHAYCTLGEICGAMREVFGEYKALAAI
jgi:methylmalonyl-CoA mutase N-terminal domain/subunit